ncbi:MAG: 5-oxoprolinase subunit PxpA [Pseudomonadota bacterium]
MAFSLNADVGEGYGCYEFGNDAALMPLITSANIACGMHAGDPSVMARTVKLAKQHGLSVGAHPGFNDIWGFGRRRLEMAIDDIEHLVTYQIGALRAIAAREGVDVRYVKPHGALNNVAADDLDVALAIGRSIRACGGGLAFVAIAGSAMVQAGQELNLETISEAYGDRRYDAKGRLVPRRVANAMIKDPHEAAQQVRHLIQNNAVLSQDGHMVPVSVDTICIHSDEPGCVDIARSIRDALRELQVDLVAI